MRVDGPTPEVVATQLAGMGARIEVLDPPEARERLARLAVSWPVCTDRKALSEQEVAR
ncbi:hypothetical protein AB0B30_19495 [Streptomyces narbonensis]|uniref:WCX domain-containing protein n=1 Tax=Streptomyces narbonensis TaxID=67333 RepID=A0ABV3CK06_9ACTN